MKIAITGGTGFLGREIIAQLAAQGHDLIAVARGQSAPTTLINGVRFARADINDTARLTEIFMGCDVVIHSAALSAPWGKTSEFFRQNVLGIQSCVAAANTAQVRRFIHVSSSSVCFAFQDRLHVREDSPLPKPVNAYAMSKQMAEREAQKFNGELFMLRPRGIYGPGDSHLLPRLLRVMQTKPLPLLRGGCALMDITDVAVVADAICTMVSAPNSAAGTYNISHGEPISIRALVEKIGQGLAIRPRWRTLPTGLAFAGARLLEALARLDPKQREPLVTAYGLGLFAFSHTLDISKAAQNLKWHPKSSLDFGLTRTLNALREAKP